MSTEDQNLALQLDALQAEGCEKVFQDTASGARSNRKGLTAALDACGSGDVRTVWKFDRLGRSLIDLVRLVEDLKARDVGPKVLTGAEASIDKTKPARPLVLRTVRGAGRIRARTDPGTDAGRYEGRKAPGPSCRASTQARAGSAGDGGS